MTSDLLLSLLGFAFVTSITPGPNNIMLMASGANFGFRRTIPHMLGISIGHSVMTAILGFGLIGIFVAVPQTYTVLKVVAVAYFLWLAWKFANAAPPEEGKAGGSPMTFLGAAAFQWANPKAWMMAIGAITAYAPGQTITAVLMVAVVFAATNFPSITLWTLLGREMGRLLKTPSRLRAFNWTMAALLVASLFPVLTH
jgi:threonine/homoserine/homoserine lactone efflux protein